MSERPESAGAVDMTAVDRDLDEICQPDGANANSAPEVVLSNVTGTGNAVLDGERGGVSDVLLTLSSTIARCDGMVNFVAEQNAQIIAALTVQKSDVLVESQELRNRVEALVKV